MCCRFSDDGDKLAVGLSNGDIKVCGNYSQITITISYSWPMRNKYLFCNYWINFRLSVVHIEQHVYRPAYELPVGL